MRGAHHGWNLIDGVSFDVTKALNAKVIFDEIGRKVPRNCILDARDIERRYTGQVIAGTDVVKNIVSTGFGPVMTYVEALRVTV